MTRNMGYALLAGLAAIVVLVSTAVFIGIGSRDDTLDGTVPGSRNSAAPASAGQWVGTWSAAPVAAEPQTRRGLPDMSIRNVVHTSVGGTGARVRLSNLYGTRPLTITHASLALAAAPSNPTAALGTMRRLTFGNSPTVTIPAGGAVTSDPARLNVPHAADLLVTTYTPHPSGPVTYHPYARQTSYVARGDRTEDSSGAAYTEQNPFWRYLTSVDVWSSETQGAVAVLGDSITDGITSSPGANRRWTDFLADRLRTERGAPRYSVLNGGISGNRVLINGPRFSPNNGPSGISRIQRDVLDRTGVKAVIVEMGVNDIIKPPRQRNPQRIVDGLRMLVREAHRRGIRVLGGTLSPFAGHPGYRPAMNVTREAVNAQIRAGHVYDGVIDFDKALRDPRHHDRLRPAYDSGDHLHPDDNGFRAMAEAVDLQALRGTRPTRL